MECEYERRKKCDSLYIERYNKLLKENERFNKQIEEYQKALDETTSEKIDLENIIDKAIEYIEDSLYVNKETGEYVLTHTFDKCNLYELLKILDNGE